MLSASSPLAASDDGLLQTCLQVARSAGSHSLRAEAPTPLPSGLRYAVVLENVAQRGGSADPKLGMLFTQVVPHCRRFGIADAIHRKPHRAQFAGDREPGAVVEHASTLCGS